MDPSPNQNPQRQPHEATGIFHSPVLYLVLFLLLLIGIALGYALHIAVMNQTNNSEVELNDKSEYKLSLPQDAVRIQTCSTGRGALYIRPNDIPRGPIYMVHNGNVVGLEYMISRSELLSDSTFSNLVGFEIPVDHLNIGSIPHGHAGYNEPHYHVDLLMITPDQQQAIVCEPGTETHMMPGIAEDETETSTNSSDSMQMMHN